MLSLSALLQDYYLVARLLGQGGMGAVYQATDHIIILPEEGTRPSEEEIQRQPSRPKQPKGVIRPALRKGAMWYGIAACSLIASLSTFGFTTPKGGQ